eukprot:g5232.t1
MRILSTLVDLARFVAHDLACSRVLVASSIRGPAKGLRQSAGLTAHHLRAARIECVEYTMAHPSSQDASRMAEMARHTGCHGIVAVGGGEVLDISKVASSIMTNFSGDTLPILDSFSAPSFRPQAAPLPLVAVATSLGVGATHSRRALLHDATEECLFPVTLQPDPIQAMHIDQKSVLARAKASSIAALVQCLSAVDAGSPLAEEAQRGVQIIDSMEDSMEDSMKETIESLLQVSEICASIGPGVGVAPALAQVVCGTFENVSWSRACGRLYLANASKGNRHDNLLKQLQGLQFDTDKDAAHAFAKAALAHKHVSAQLKGWTVDDVTHLLLSS